MPPTSYILKIKQTDYSKFIEFANNSDDFLEVIFTIDNKDVKFGKPYSLNLRGYAYPPRFKKPIKKMKNGTLLPFRNLRSGEVKAYIFRGKGAFYEGDIEIPTFLRQKMAKSIKFKRTDNEPCEVLSVKY